MSEQKKAAVEFLSKPLHQLILLVMLAVLSYGNTVLNGYSMDDHIVVSDNENVQKGLAGIPGILTSHYLTIDGESFEYRPIAQLTLALEYQIFGENPHVSHAINVLLYALFVLLVYRLFSEIFDSEKKKSMLPFFVALLFAVHPSHTEIVASIKNREEILSVGFALLTMLYAWRYFSGKTAGNKGLLLPLLFLLLSFTSKISSMYIVGVIILLGVFRGYHRTRKFPFYALSFLLFGLAIAYFIIMWKTSSRTVTFTENPLVMSHSISERLGTASLTLWFYLRFMFVPWPFRFYYGYNMIPMSPLYDPMVLLSIAVHIALLVLGFRWFKKKRPAGFFVLSYFGSILLYSNLIVLATGIVTERALFLPGLWLIAFVVWAVSDGLPESIKQHKHRARWVSALMIVLVPAAMAWTIHRNTQWKDQLTLMSSDIENLRESAPANYMYATLLNGIANNSNSSEERDVLYKKALRHYHRTLAVTEDSPDALFQIGMIQSYYYQQSDSAAYYFKSALALDTAFRNAQFQLARTYYLQNRLQESDSLFADLYRKQASDSLTLYFYSQVLFLNGQPVKAIGTAEKLIQLYPDSYYGYMTLGVLYERQGELQKAMPYFEKGTELGGRDEYVHNAMSKYYLAIGRLDLLEELKRKYRN